MNENIFTRLYSVLLEEIDGPAADRFLCHVSGLLGDFESISKKHHPVELLQWMIQYWVEQLSRHIDKGDLHVLYPLMYSVDEDTFLQAFRTIALPLISENDELPNLSSAVMAIPHYPELGGQVVNG